jgi:hypothetical protein
MFRCLSVYCWRDKLTLECALPNRNSETAEESVRRGNLLLLSSCRCRVVFSLLVVAVTVAVVVVVVVVAVVVVSSSE